MRTTRVFQSGGSQAVRLPKEFRMPGKVVSIRRDGRAVILEPVAPARWPTRLWSRIRIADPAFARPAQGRTPRRRALEGTD